MSFRGIPSTAFEFFDRLEADNSKAWWTANKQTYDDDVRAPLVALLDDLADEFGTGHVFRPYRDVRFAKDKRPYKDHAGAFVEVADAVGYYLEVSGDGLLVAGGWYDPQGPQVARYRDVVAGPAGAELEGIVTTVRAAGLSVGGQVLKTRPRGIDPDHPRLELLRHRSVVASRAWDPARWMQRPAARDRVRSAWRDLTPLVGWLAASVGPGDPDRHRR